MKKNQNILIVGAGLCGSLLALRMAQQGFQITLIEKRPDIRKVTLDAGRSINLALSNRGLRSLRLAGLEKEAKKLLIPMTGRMIHEKSSGKTFLSPYSGREDEFINSVSRPGLNKLLLNEVDKLPNVTTIFNHECIAVDFEHTTATFREFDTNRESVFQADAIFGTDGAGSAVRSSMIHDPSFLFNISHQWLSHGYKELEILADKNDSYKIFKNALHIWPRGEYMLIALPNLDGSFTVTLFLPHKGEPYSFETLTSKEVIENFFSKEFPDVLELIPNLTQQFFENPIGTLGTIKCSPWHHSGNVLIMGDAAHAMVPFYAQGMNSSFEDVAEFIDILEKHKDKLGKGENGWDLIFDEFQEKRIKNAEAICDLSLDNFEEMKAHTGLPIFQEKRKLEIAFESEFPSEYNSKYSLVTFRDNIPYFDALQKGRAQDTAILNMIYNNELPNSLSLEEKLSLVNNRTQEILNEEGLDYLKYSDTDF